MIADLLRWIGRHGRLALIAGLAAGLALPGLSAAIRPGLPWLVAGLIFLSALRIGMRAAVGNLGDARASLGRVLAMQVAVPVAGVVAMIVAGIADTPVGLALTLALSAPSIAGSPAFAVMLGRDPAPAMRLLILGTALFPLTVLPVLWLSPALGGPAEVAGAALRLIAVIVAAAAAAFALRRRFFPDPSVEVIGVLDGVLAIALAVLVTGLMSAVVPALAGDPMRVLGWLALACVLNFGLQFAARAAGLPPGACIVAGNRNVALFLVALPAATTDPILIFIGCYQVPMFLTPILMGRVYRDG
ncbi:hypothetical protein [Psychromarinibacter halotolerans]|uniref:BASS family bile acid:Na+ symporter n=1 Tax=Psychromarinibacter halotolerans TaxID=1775175 RepID=A0ABV7GKV4_9RHOB